MKELIKQAHENAVRRDFYKCRDCNFVDMFYGENIRNKLNCTNCNNTGKTAKLNVYNDMKKELEEFIKSKPLQYFHKDSEQSEIADMIMILLAYCGEMGYDIEKAIVEKLEYNKVRV